MLLFLEWRKAWGLNLVISHLKLQKSQHILMDIPTFSFSSFLSSSWRLNSSLYCVPSPCFLLLWSRTIVTIFSQPYSDTTIPIFLSFTRACWYSVDRHPHHTSAGRRPKLQLSLFLSSCDGNGILNCININGPCQLTIFFSSWCLACQLSISFQLTD